MSPAATQELFKKAWGGYLTGVSLITFYTGEGEIHGLTANSSSSLSLDPMLVLVSVDHKTRSFPMLSNQKRLVMNLLSKGQKDVSTFFARSDTHGTGPFKFGKTAHGYPFLEGCTAYFDCEIVARHAAGDHTIFISKVDEIEVFGGEPLGFLGGKYMQAAPMA